jgi:hypothetical protein
VQNLRPVDTIAVVTYGVMWWWRCNQQPAMSSKKY